MTSRPRAAGALAAAAIACAAPATIIGFVGDTTLEGGWYAFEDTFDVDMTPIIHGGEPYETVTHIDYGFGGESGTIHFPPHSLRHIGSGWAHWSHGYEGEVFYSNGAVAVTYTFEGDAVGAFDAYLSPNWEPNGYVVTAHGSEGGEATVEFEMLGIQEATHFGFFATGEAIVAVKVMGSKDYAIGEWRVGVPAPATAALLSIAGLYGRRHH